MPATPIINAVVTITAIDINGNSVAKTFNNVTGINFDFWDGTINIIDKVQGAFYFGLATVATLTYTVAGTVTTIVIA